MLQLLQEAIFTYKSQPLLPMTTSSNCWEWCTSIFQRQCVCPG